MERSRFPTLLEIVVFLLLLRNNVATEEVQSKMHETTFEIFNPTSRSSSDLQNAGLDENALSHKSTTSSYLSSKHKRLLLRSTVTTRNSTTFLGKPRLLASDLPDLRIRPRRNAVSMSTRGTIAPLVIPNEDLQAILIHQRRDKVRQMMKHAWDGYVQHAWGYQELSPVSRQSHSSTLFGDSGSGVTIIDSLDTLYIMGLMEEFQQGREWVDHNLDFRKLHWGEVSVFEINIRFVGGLLSCFALTGDPMFREKALLVAEKLLPAFDTPTGIPLGIINVETGASRNPLWASEGSSILSEFGTLSLEFNYLSDITEKDIFRQKMQKLMTTIKKLDRKTDGGLYPNFVNPMTGEWGERSVSMGAFGDSFYEYLLKSWLFSGRQDDEARLMYIDAVEAAMSKLIQVSKGGLVYFAESNSGRLEHKMQHLACFSGGMLALGGFYLGEPYRRRHMSMGRAITRTCHESYIRTASKLGPETFRFNDQLEAEGLEPEAGYFLRPEVVESYFVLWRLTHDPIYREWGWEVVEALEKHCRVEGGGYSGLKDVNVEKPIKDDIQQSFFLAETLKYLYLLFSDDDVIPLDQWVFNTEAHPFPIEGINVSSSLKILIELRGK